MYTANFKLYDNEIPAKIDLHTGEVKKITRKSNNLPPGTSKLNYKEFGILNIELTSILEGILTNTEISILFKMISRCYFNTNSLAPLSNQTTIRELSEIFNISKNHVSKIFSKLFKLGVYAQFNISENAQEKEYWILNPYIFWRGRTIKDSIFENFKNTAISKLIK